MRKVRSCGWLVVIGLFVSLSMLSANSVYAQANLAHVELEFERCQALCHDGPKHVNGLQRAAGMEIEVEGQNIDTVVLHHPLGPAMLLRERLSQGGFYSGYEIWIDGGLDEVLARFPDGTYQFVIKYRDGSHQTINAVLGGEFPDYPVFTNHMPGDVLDPNNTTFEWNAVGGGPVWEYALGIEAEGTFGANLSVDFPSGQPSYTYNVPPGLLEYGQNYGADIEAEGEGTGGAGWTTQKSSASLYWFSTLPPPAGDGQSPAASGSGSAGRMSCPRRHRRK